VTPFVGCLCGDPELYLVDTSASARAYQPPVSAALTAVHEGGTIAACAERHNATVIHYDSDYEVIAEVTGQPVDWVVPRGTVQ
jgi:hypothetical protein